MRFELMLSGLLTLLMIASSPAQDRAELNLKSDTGVLYEVEGFTDHDLFIKARRLVKTGAGTYVASDGFITACDEAVPKWSFKLKKASIQLGSSARIQHTLFRITEIPISYLPYVALNSRFCLNYFWERCGVSVDFRGFNLRARQESQIRFAFFLKGIGSLGTLRRPRSSF